MGKPMFDSRGSSLVENLAVIWCQCGILFDSATGSVNPVMDIVHWGCGCAEPASAAQAVPSPERNDE